MDSNPKLCPDSILCQLSLGLDLSKNMLCHSHQIDWWDLAFLPVPASSTPQLRNTMLYLIAYDITSPKRLRKVAIACLDFGVRVQYSLFECRLNPDHFDVLWLRLNEIIDPDQDRIVSYTLDSDNAAKTLTAGTMEISTPVVCYLI